MSMQFMILPYSKMGGSGVAGAPDDMPAWIAYTEALAKAGILRGGEELASPDEAAVIRVRNGARNVEDGPYADTKEQLGGFFLIEVEDRQAAMEWAARCPAAATGAVELRPVILHPR